MIDFNLKDTIQEYINNQRNDLNLAEIITDKIKSFSKIECTSSCPPDFNELLLKNVLYYFELVEESPSELEICEMIVKAKSITKIKFPKVNNNKGKILYVGKSTGLLSNRIKQHFSSGSKHTYALYLKEWKDIFGKEVRLNLYYINLNNLLQVDSQHILELFESALHFKLKPILGRTGH